jgi:glutamate dehydrogenase
VQTRLFHAIAAIVDQAVRWFLLSGLTLDHAACVTGFKPGVDSLADTLSSLLPEPEQRVNAAREAAHIEAGVPAALARRVVVLNTLSTAMDIVQIAQSLDRDVSEIGRLYFATGVDYGLLLLRRQARVMPTTTHWQRLAADAVTDDSYVQQREITSRLIAAGRKSAAAAPGSALQEVLAEVTRTTPPDLAMLTVASRRIRAASA